MERLISLCMGDELERATGEGVGPYVRERTHTIAEVLSSWDDIWVEGMRRYCGFDKEDELERKFMADFRVGDCIVELLESG